MLWDSMMRLVRAVHTQPTSVANQQRGPLSVAERYEFGSWKLLYNEVEVRQRGEPYNPCRIQDYAREGHPLFSFACAQDEGVGRAGGDGGLGGHGGGDLGSSGSGGGWDE